MSATTEGANQLKNERRLREFEESAAQVAAPKGKNHPSFTLILRKQLPFCFDLQGLEASSTLLANDGESAEKLATAELTDAPSESLPQVIQDFPLAHAWQLWVLDDIQARNKDWNVKRVGTLACTAQEFWSVYSQVYNSSEAYVGSLNSLMIFQDAIEPKWEHKANLRGGRWFFDVSYSSRGESSRRECLLRQNYWTFTLQTVLSGRLGSYGDLITGLILLLKPSKYRVALWTRACPDFNQVIQLGTCLRNCLNLRCQLKFELHSPSPSSTVLELN